MRQIRVRFLADLNPVTPQFDACPDDVEICFMPLETVWADDRLDTSRRRSKVEVASGYVRFMSGDILCPKVTPTFQAGRSAIMPPVPHGVGAATTEVHVLRVLPERADPRFVRYALLTKRFLEEGVSRFQGVAGLQRVPADFVADFQVAAVPLDMQRRIADFLDDQVTRIDQVIELRREQKALLLQRQVTWLDDRMIGPSDPWVRLSWVANLQSGLALNSRDDTAGTEKRPYLRVANVKATHLDLSLIKEVAVTPQQIRRFALQPGDVLMTEGGDRDKLGRGTLWRGEIPGVLHQNHVFAIRPDPTRLCPAFLATLTQTTQARRYFESTGNQSTNLASTNASTVLSWRIPLPALAEQERRAALSEKTLTVHRTLESGWHASENLLAERKRSLISAAVTGEFDVSTASSRASHVVMDGVGG